MSQRLISIIVPVYNESASLPALYKELKASIHDLRYKFEFIFIDDGSQDNSSAIVQDIAAHDSKVHLIAFARNFGKEIAVTAGLHAARGQAAIVLDADLQHPPALIKQFIHRWEKGATIVVGVRQAVSESLFKQFASRAFYWLLGLISSTNVTPHATDYRLLDRAVIDAFGRFTERHRLTRGLIDWLGFEREYIYFKAPARQHGGRSYSYRQLVRLAIDSLTTHSLFPLKLAGYLGMIILLLAGPLGIFVYIEKYILDDPYSLRITGTATLAIILLFLVGLILVCLGLIALYIAHIHAEVINRPLYVVKPAAPWLGMDEEDANE